MLTSSDQQLLEYRTGERGRRFQSLLIGISALTFFMSLFHFYIALTIGRMVGYSWLALLTYWSQSIRYEKMYPGYIIFVFAQLEATVVYFGLAIVMAVFAWARHRERAREQRIVEALKSAGQW